MPHHPGGPLIYVAAGKDCTQLFESYHPLAVRRVRALAGLLLKSPSQARARGSGLLPKFCVGELHLAAGEAAGVTEFQADLGEGQFYAVLKTRVEGYFKEHQARRAPPLRARLAHRPSPRSWTLGCTRRCL